MNDSAPGPDRRLWQLAGRVLRVMRSPHGRESGAIFALKSLDVIQASLWGFLIFFLATRLGDSTQAAHILFVLAIANAALMVDAGLTIYTYASTRQKHLSGECPPPSEHTAILSTFLLFSVVVSGAIYLLFLREEETMLALFGLGATLFYLLSLPLNFYGSILKATDHFALFLAVDLTRKSLCTLFLATSYICAELIYLLPLFVVATYAGSTAWLAWKSRISPPIAWNPTVFLPAFAKRYAEVKDAMGFAIMDMSFQYAPYFALNVLYSSPTLTISYDLFNRIRRLSGIAVQVANEALTPTLTRSYARGRMQDFRNIWLFLLLMGFLVPAIVGAAFILLGAGFAHFMSDGKADTSPLIIAVFAVGLVAVNFQGQIGAVLARINRFAILARTSLIKMVALLVGVAGITLAGLGEVVFLVFYFALPFLVLLHLLSYLNRVAPGGAKGH